MPSSLPASRPSLPGRAAVLIVAVFAAGLLAGPGAIVARGADEAVILKSGEVVAGTVVSVSDTAVEFDLAGVGRRSIPIADIKAGSLYTLRSTRIADGDAQARLALGRWCLAQELGYFAQREFEQAARIDPTVAAEANDGLAKARLLRGREFYARAVEAMQAQRYDEARRLFDLVIAQYPDPFAGPARAALDFIDRQRGIAPPAPLPGGNGGAPPAAPPAGAPPPGAPPPPAKVLDAASQARLEAAGQQVRHLTQAGYLAGTDSRAKRHWAEATEVVNQALATLDAWRQRGRIDEAAWAQLRAPFVEAGTDHALQIAVIELRQHDEYSAQKWLARALILDPDNERAQELRLFIVTEFRPRH